MLPEGYTYYETRYEGKRRGFVKDDSYFIPIGKNAKDGYAIVDLAFSYAEDYKWRMDSHGYPITTVFNTVGKRTNLGLHHFIAGKPNKGFVVDHINRNKLDCRSKNLRIVSQGVNSFNRQQSSKSRSPYPGVRPKKGGWTVEIHKDGRYYYLGHFQDLEEAIRIRKNAEALFYRDYDGDSRRKQSKRSRYGN